MNTLHSQIHLRFILVFVLASLAILYSAQFLFADPTQITLVNQNSNVELVDIARDPIVLNQPVIWNVTLAVGNETTNVVYTTPSIVKGEELSIAPNGEWQLNISLHTLSIELYKNVSFFQTVPSLESLEFSKQVNYTVVNDTSLFFHFDQVAQTESFRITGTARTEQNLTTNLTEVEVPGGGTFGIAPSEGVVEFFDVTSDLLISFAVANLTPGAAIQTDIHLPFAIPQDIELFLYKQQGDNEVLVPYNVSEQGDIITLYLEDGVIDDDGIVDGRIVDPLQLFRPTMQANVQGVNASGLLNESVNTHVQARFSDSQTNGTVVISASQGHLEKVKFVEEGTVINSPSTDFKYHLLSFEVANVTNTTDVTFTYDTQLPEDMTYWKFNPVNATWFAYPFTRIDPFTIQITLEDGGLGDVDGLVNGRISDPGGVGGTWANESWQYRTNITLTNTQEAQNVSFVQVQLNMSGSSVGDNFNWVADETALRYYWLNATDDSEIYMPYWIEYWNSSAQEARVWVNVTMVPGSTTDLGFGNGVAKLVMYYGNPSATNVSNGTDTFIYFNDFEDVVGFDTGDLGPSLNDTVYKEGSGSLQGVGSAGYDQAVLSGSSSAGRNITVESWVYTYDAPFSGTNVSLAGVTVARPTAGADLDGYQAYYDERASGLFGIREDYNSGDVKDSVNVGAAFFNWYYLEFTWLDNGSLYAAIFDDTKSPLGTIEATDTTYSTGEFGVGAYNNALWDTYKVRKHIQGAPAISFGTVEEFVGILNGSIDLPAAFADFDRNNLFTMNGTAECVRGDCYNVTVKYQFLSTGSPEQTLTETTLSDFSTFDASENVSIGASLSLDGNFTATPWWNNAWPFRSSFNITATSNISDLEVAFNVNDTFVGGDFNWTSDQNQSRYVWYNASNGESVEIPFWTERWNATAQNATVWLDLPFIEEDTNTTIWIYYGNDGASNGNNGSATFFYFNDFEESIGFDTGSLNPTRLGSSNFSGDFGASADGGENYYQESESGIQSGQGVVIESYVRTTLTGAAASLAGIAFGRPTSAGESDGYQYYIDERGGPSHGIRLDYSFSNVIGSSNSPATAYSTWYYMSLAWLENNSMYATLYDENQVEIGSFATTDATYTDGEFGLAAFGQASWDEFKVRRYSEVQPTLEGTNQQEGLLYESTSQYISDPLDLGADEVELTNVSFTTTVPSDTTLALETRTSAGGAGAWFDTDWLYRKNINVSNTGGNLTDYQIFVSLNSTVEFGNNNLTSDCRDVIFVYVNGTTQQQITHYTDWCDSSLDNQTDFWVKVPEMLNDTVTQLYMYYGNPSATSTSDIVNTFSYSSPKTVGYVVSNNSVNTGMSVISLANNNDITIGSNTLSLDEYATSSVSSGIDVASQINATGLVNVEGSGADTDSFVPISWAGTEFYYADMRANAPGEEFCMVSPWGTATVDIYDAGILQVTTTVDQGGSCINNDIGSRVQINSTLPILVSEYGLDGRDSLVFYPATTLDLYGPSGSSSIGVGGGPDGASVTCYGSDGTTDPGTIVANGEDNCNNVDGGTGEGAGNAVRIVTDGPIGANQQGDGSGGESSVFVPRKEMGTVFGSAIAAEYIAVVSPQDAVNCTLTTSSTTIESQLTSGDPADFVTKSCFDCNVGAQLVAGGWKLSCTAPVWMYYEKESQDAETNVWSYKQMRQFVYPTPVVEINTTQVNQTEIVGDPDNFVWSSWFIESTDQDVQSPDARYIQYRLTMNTTNTSQTPQFDDITFTYKVTALEWTDMEESGTLFTTTSPFVCGPLASSDSVCTPELSVLPRSLGNYSVRLQVVSNNTLLESINTTERNISVFLQPVMSNFIASETTVTRGDEITLQVTMEDEAAAALSNYNLSFADEVANGTRLVINTNLTNGAGTAYVTYTIQNDSTFGAHTLNVSYAGDASQFVRYEELTTSITVSSTPEIVNITTAPPIAGFGQNIVITANVTDALGLDTVRINITNQTGDFEIYDMTPASGDNYTYTWDRIWTAEVYNFTIIANNTDGVEVMSSLDNFSLIPSLSFNFRTNETFYSAFEIVEIDGISWFNDSWTQRIPVTIQNTASDQYEYQVYVTQDFTGQYSIGAIQEFCQDVRFTWLNTSDNSEVEMDFYTDTCNLNANGEANFWAQVPFLQNATNNTIYMYFSNPTATNVSNITATFSYSEPRVVGYVVADEIVTNDLDIVSYVDGNNVSVEGTYYALDRLQTQAVTSGFTRASSVSARFPISAEGSAGEDTMIVPASWAGTYFTYGGLRGTTHDICMLSPWGDASVELFDGTSSVYTTTVDATGECYNYAFTDTNAIQVVSDIPILVSHESGADAFVFYPATTDDLYGASISNDVDITSGNTSASITCIGSDNETSPTSVPLGGESTDCISVSDNYGQAQAIRIITTQPIGATQQADSDGNEQSVFAPRKEFGTTFGSANGFQYLTWVSDQDGVQCDITDTSGPVVTNYSSGNTDNNVYKGCVDCGSDADRTTNPWVMECNAPVWMYFEGSDDDETNAFGEKQMRQYVYPEPVVSNNASEGKPGLVNLGQGNNTVYLRMLTQFWDGSTWINKVPPIVLDQEVLIVNSTQSFDIVEMWAQAGGWNTSAEEPGLYRVIAILEDDDRNNLFDINGDQIFGTSEFYISNATFQVTNLSHENQEQYGLFEYDVGDNIAFINVSVLVINNTAFDANISLDILDNTLASTGWGPLGEIQNCGNVTENDVCYETWDNSSNGYEIPLDASAGTFQFFWNVSMVADNGPVKFNNSVNFTIHYVPGNVTADTALGRISKPNSTLYTVNISNPWSVNMSNVTIEIACPALSGFSCNSTTDGSIYFDIGEIGAKQTANATFNISVNESVASADYDLNVTLNYTNGGGENKSYSNVGVATLEVRNLGILEITVVDFPTNVTRGFGGYLLSGRVNNTGDSIAYYGYLNYTLPTGWTNTSGNASQLYASLNPSEIAFNNITVLLDASTAEIGPVTIELDSGANDSRLDFTSYSIDVFAASSIVAARNQSIVDRGTSIEISAQLLYDNGSALRNQLVNFTDVTYSVPLGTAYTNDSGHANVSYFINSTSALGFHTINATYVGNESIYVRENSSTIVIDVHQRPSINSVTITPSLIGFGNNISITADISDNDDVDTVFISVILPNGSTVTQDLSYAPTTASGTFNNTWLQGVYQFSITANDTLSSTQTNGTFNVTLDAGHTVTVETVNESYGQNELVNLTAPTAQSWWNGSWDYKVPLNISNWAEDVWEYQVFVEYDFTTAYAESKVQESCNDVVFTYWNQTSNEESNISFVKQSCDVSGSGNASFWVQVPYIANQTNTTIMMYYGNPDISESLEDEVGTFTYSEPRRIGYLLSSNAVTNGVEFASWIPQGGVNTVRIGSQEYNITNMTTQTDSTGLSISDAIFAEDLVHIQGQGTEDDMVVPISWAGTEFVMGGMRGNDEFCVISPWGTATVEIFDNGVSQDSRSIGTSGSCYNVDITDDQTARVTATLPVLVFHEATDAWVFYPAITDPVYGPSVSGNGPVTASTAGASVRVTGHSSGASTFTLVANQEDALENYVTAAQHGEGEAVKVDPQGDLIGALQQADGDGGESTIFVPQKEMGTLFVGTGDVEYLVGVTDSYETTCSLYDTGGLVDTNTSTGTQGSGVHKIIFNAPNHDAVYASGPWYVTCDNPAWFYYEDFVSGNGEETNMFGYRQMRQQVYPFPIVSTTSEVSAGSQVVTYGDVNSSAYLLLKVQKNVSNSWVDIETIEDDLADNRQRTIDRNNLDVSAIWNPISWDTSTNGEGEYRVYAELQDQYGNALQDEFGSDLVDSYIFEITAPPLQLDIAEIRVYEVTDTSPANWKIFTNDFIGKGTNTTFTLTEGSVYRFEVDVDNIGGTLWEFNQTNVSYANFNSSWGVDANLEIWYSSESSLSNKRTDTGFDGGVYDGEVVWNTTELGGNQSAGSNATFFFIINMTTSQTNSVLFEIVNENFVLNDSSTIQVLDVDNEPPVLVNSQYDTVPENITRGDDVLVYAQWNEDLSEANLTYTTTNPLIDVVITNTSPSNPENWTNFTLSSTSSWFLGPHTANILAVDLLGNVNNTLPDIIFNVFGTAQLATGSINVSTINVSDSVEILCRVVDLTNSQGVANYTINFTNSTGMIGSNITNATGWSSIRYQDGSAGSETVGCFIVANVSAYYDLDSQNETSFSLLTLETVPPFYTGITGPTYENKGVFVDLATDWNDNFELDYALLEINESGVFTNVSSEDLSGASQTSTQSYQLSTSMTPGNITWRQHVNDTSGNWNMTPWQPISVFGFSSVQTININPASAQANTRSNVTCNVIDSNSSTALANYQVDFWYKLTSNPTYTLFGSNFTNGTGTAWQNISLAGVGLYDILCNVTDAPQLMYNYSTDNSETSTLNIVAGSDVDPPYILGVGENYTINETQILRNQCVYVSGLWNENINQSYVIYNSTSSNQIQVNISPPYTDDWTNLTLCTDNSWTPANYSIKLFARDNASNLNDTLETFEFVMRGRSEVFYEGPVGSQNRDVLTLFCNVTDTDTMAGVANYPVSFIDGDLGFSIGTNLTNSSGHAVFTYDYSTAAVGPDIITCQIETNASLYYTAVTTTDSGIINFFADNLNATITDPVAQQIVHRGENVSLEVYVTDENDLPESGFDVEWYNASDTLQGSANESGWKIPTDYPLGPENITVNVSKTFFGDGNDSVEVLVFGWADIDYTIPAGDLIVPANNLVNLTCFVSDNHTGSGIQNYPVQFRRNGALLATNNSNSSGYAFYSFNSNTLSNGNYDYSCGIGDEASIYYNDSTQRVDNHTITIDKTVPNIAFTSTTSASGVTVGVNFTGINVTATDTNLDVVKLNFSGTVYDFVINNSPLRFRNMTDLADGLYEYFAFANDTAGNYNSTEIRNITIDTTAPTITVVTPSDGEWFNTSAVNFTFALNEVGNSCVYSVGGAANISLNQWNDTHFSNLTTISNGYYNVEVFCNDTVGNMGSTTFNVGVDDSPVVVSLNAPENGIFLNYSTINFSAELTDNFGVINVTLYHNNSGTWTPISTNTTESNNINYTFFDTVGNDTIEWNMLACDNATCSFAPTNNTFIVDIGIPELIIRTPENISYADTTVMLNISAIDKNLDTCLYSLDGAANQSIDNCENVSLSGLSEGQHNVDIWINDSAQNQNYTEVFFIVDVTTPGVTLESPIDGENYTNDNDLEFNYSVSDNIRIDSCFYELDGATNVTLPGCANTTLLGLSNAQHTLILYVNDTANNINSTSISFLVNLTNLVATPEFPFNNSFVNLSNVPLNVTVNAPATACNFSINGGAYNNPMSNISELRWIGSQSLADGNYNVSYRCATATNVSTTTQRNFTIDTITPGIGIEQPDNITYASTNINFTFNITEQYNTTCSYRIDNQSFVTLSNCQNTSFSVSGDGVHNITLRVEDQALNRNETITHFSVDTSNPVLTIGSPLAQNYTVSDIIFNLTVDEAVNACYYNLDGGSNTTMTQQSFFVYNDTQTLADGTYQAIFYCNDTVNNQGTASVTFDIDTTGPIVSFVDPTPLDGGGVAENSLIINISADETVDVALLEWTNSSGSYNLTMDTLSTTDYELNVSNLEDGTYTYKVFVNDTLGNLAIYGPRTAIVSTSAPIITLQSPIASTTYTDNLIDLNASSNKEISRWWFSLNGKSNLTFFPNTTFAGALNSNSITVYAEDTSGLIGNTSVSFTVDVTEWNDTFFTLTGQLDPVNVSSNESAEIGHCFEALYTTDSSASAQDQLDTCWQYRKDVNLSISSGTVNDYQVLVDLDLSAEVAAGKASNDCSDIRFTFLNESAQEQEIDYYVQGCNELNNGRVWLEVPIVNASTRAFVYYGNPYAESQSNATAVFNLYEDFSVLESSEWGTGVSNWQIQSGIATPTTTGVSSRLTHQTYSYENDVIVDVTGAGNSSSGQAGYVSIGNGAGSKYLRLIFDPANNRVALFNGAFNYFTVNSSIEQNYTVVADFTGDNYTLYVNDTLAVNVGSAASGAFTAPLINAFVTYGLRLNDLFVREYGSEQPSVSFGDEQQALVSQAEVQSILLSPSPLGSWGEFAADISTPGTTSAIFQLRDVNNASLCGNLTEAQVSSGYTLCPAADTADGIYLYALFESSVAGQTPTMDSWRINWSTALPELIVIDGSGAVLTTTQNVNDQNVRVQNVTITFDDPVLKQINITNYAIGTSTNNTLYLQNSTNDSIHFDDTFFVDPTDLSFDTMDITFAATGKYLFKCENFSRSNVSCIEGDDEGYSIVADDLVSGLNYTYTITPTDPGFGITVEGDENITDARLRSNRPNDNYGGSNRLRVGRNTASNTFRSIIDFNLSYISSTATVTNATLMLYFDRIPGSDATASRTHALHRVQQEPLRDWPEDEVTWANYSSTALWSSAGGDFNATQSANATISSADVGSWINFTVTDDVQSFIENASQNFGWVIKDVSETINKYRVDYASAEFSTASLRPRLVVNFSESVPDLTVLNITNVGSSIESENATFSINVTNGGDGTADNFTVELNISRWNGTAFEFNQTRSAVFVNLTADNSTLIDFEFTNAIGIFALNATVDVYGQISELDEANNTFDRNFSISSYNIYYGTVLGTEVLGDYSSNLLTQWNVTLPEGNKFFADYDAAYNPWDLAPLNGTSDLSEADTDLGLDVVNDSLSYYFDTDSNGVPDQSMTITIAGLPVENIPIINSTNTSAFITGLLWDTADGGTQYDGTQDLVVVTLINATQPGLYGTYDFEIRIPAPLGENVGSIDLISRVDELI